jgi:alpha-glucosidase
VPLPWTRTGDSFGFGPGGAHLPQPAWFADCSVEAQEGVADSTLRLFRAALAARRELLAEEKLVWVEAGPDTGADVLHFVRPGGWQVVTNLGDGPTAVPPGDVLLSSGPLADGQLPTDTTVWLRT